MEEPSEFLDGEETITKLKCALEISDHANGVCIKSTGNLYVTNFALHWEPTRRSTSHDICMPFPLPLGCIYELSTKKIDSLWIMTILPLDYRCVRIIKFCVSQNLHSSLLLVEKEVQKLTETLPTGSFAQLNHECSKPEKEFYDPRAEFEQFNTDTWRMTDINIKGKFASSYPKIFIVPKAVTDKRLRALRSESEDGKIPILSWISVEKKIAILRTGSIKRKIKGDIVAGGVKSHISSTFKSYLAEIDACSWRSVIYNIIPYTSSDITDSLIEFFELCKAHSVSEKSDTSDNWHNTFLRTAYMRRIRGFVKYVRQVISQLAKSEHTAIVECSPREDGCVAALTCLIKICVDARFRTFQGFAELIEKEWIAFGYDFFETKSKKQAPLCALFVLFIDCVWQIMEQFPKLFSWNDNFLHFILDSIHSHRFGTFLYKKQKRDQLREKLPSIWSYVQMNLDLFKNTCYVDENVPVLPVAPHQQVTKFWSGYFLKVLDTEANTRVDEMLNNVNTTGLTELDLSKQGLYTVPTITDTYLGLEKIDLSFNNINSVCTELMQLPKLIELNLCGNCLPMIPSQMFEMIDPSAESVLKFLNISDNWILSLPSKIYLFQNLTHLYASGNLLTSIPYQIYLLSNLEVLDLSNNKIKSDIEMDSSREPPCLGKLVELKLGNNSICTIGETFLNELGSLKVLDLSNNLIKNFPSDSLTHMENLEILNLQGNQTLVEPSVTQVDLLLHNISKCNNLTELYLSHLSTKKSSSSKSMDSGSNPKTEHIFDFGFLDELTHLEVFECSNSKVCAFPEQICGLTNLRELRLTSNYLTYISEKIDNLSNLKILDISCNYLKELPDGFGALKELTTLLVNNNKLAKLPPQMGFLDNLNELDVQNNNKLNIPKGHLNRGVLAIKEYLKQCYQGMVPCYRMKLMLVGEEEVGKTSLLRCLKKVKKKKTISVSTDGIDIGELKISIPEKKDDTIVETEVNLSVWDFGGQELYYTTHQFFLSERSLYLVIFKATIPKEQNLSIIKHWLFSIAAKIGNKTPIILVGTHIDFEVCTSEYIQSYGIFLQTELTQYTSHFAVKQIHFVSCEQESGLEYLKRGISDILLEEEHVGADIPKSYLLLEEILERRGENEKALGNPPILDFEGYRNLAATCGITHKEELAAVTETLHNLGVLMHFTMTTTIKSYVILDPQWLTNLMSTIITTKNNFVHSGFLFHDDIQHIWKEPAYPQHLHKFLMELLENFDIIFDLLPFKNIISNIDTKNVNKPVSLVPSLLEEKIPISGLNVLAEFTHPESVYGRYYYFEFLPSGFFSRLIIHLLAYQRFDVDFEVSHFWRYGVIGKRKEQIILITHHVQKDLIRILVFSRESTNSVNNAHKLFNGVTATMNSLMADWYKLNGRIMIPCSHCIDSFDFCKQMYEEREAVTSMGDSNDVTATILSDETEIFFFTYKECQEEVMNGNSLLYCNGSIPVRLDHLVPDLIIFNLQDKSITYDEINLEGKLGEGAFSSVYKATLSSGEIVAIKQIKLPAPDKQDSEHDLAGIFEEFCHEIWIMSSIKHHNLLEFKGYCSESGFAIITDYVPLGSLYDHLKICKNDMKWPMRLKIAKDIAKGCNFLHSCAPPILHGDLKSPNILLIDLSDNAPVVAKVCDFGMANNFAWGKLKGTKVENPIWLAPEILGNKPYTLKADIYAYALILWELLSGEQFLSKVEFFCVVEEMILAEEREEIPDDLEVPEYKDLITDAWQGDPLARPTFSECIDRLNLMMTKYYPEIAGYDREFLEEIKRQEKEKRKIEKERRKKEALEMRNLAKQAKQSKPKINSKKGKKKKGKKRNSLRTKSSQSIRTRALPGASDDDLRATKSSPIIAITSSSESNLRKTKSAPSASDTPIRFPKTKSTKWSPSASDSPERTPKKSTKLSSDSPERIPKKSTKLSPGASDSPERISKKSTKLSPSSSDSPVRTPKIKSTKLSPSVSDTAIRLVSKSSPNASRNRGSSETKRRKKSKKRRTTHT